MLQDDLDSLTDYQLKTIESIITCNAMIMNIQAKKRNPINTRTYFSDNTIKKIVKNNKTKVFLFLLKIKNYIETFNRLVDKRQEVCEKESSNILESDKKTLLLTKICESDTYGESLKNKVEQYHSLKIVTEIEKDLISAKDTYDRANEEIIYSKISIVRIIRNMQFKIIDRKEYLNKIKFSANLTIYEKCAINIVVSSKCRYKSILNKAIEISYHMGLTIVKQDDEYLVME